MSAEEIRQSIFTRARRVLHLDTVPPSRPYASDLTAEQHREIAATQREVTARRIRARNAEQLAAHKWAVEIAEAQQWIDLEATWRERLEGQQRVIDSLLEYIASLPVAA